MFIKYSKRGIDTFIAISDIQSINTGIKGEVFISKPTIDVVMGDTKLRDFSVDTYIEYLKSDSYKEISDSMQTYIKPTIAHTMNIVTTREVHTLYKYEGFESVEDGMFVYQPTYKNGWCVVEKTQFVDNSGDFDRIIEKINGLV